MDPVTHFELPYDDAARIARFYQQAFAWETRALGEEMGNYVLATTSQKADPVPHGRPGAIDGGFFPRKADWPAQVPSVVIAVRDIRKSMQKIRDAGGEVLGEPMMIPGIGDYVSFFDTERNRLSILQPLPMQA